MCRMNINMCSSIYPVAAILLCSHLLSAFQITGAPISVNTSLQDLPQRREINEFTTSGPEFDLYILALQRLQTRDQADPLSYFQIAGIHGYPKQAWDGVNGSGNYPGFCAHAAVIFPTWHRAYLALFEQMISRHAHTIAELYPLDQRERYRAAAQRVRIPYWDWAFTPGLPPITTMPTINVNTPERFQSVMNPLYEYRFHPGSGSNGFPAGHPLSKLNMTTRYFNTTTRQRNDSAATAVLVSNAANTLTMTYQLLSSVSNYTSMSCTLPGGMTNRVMNLEVIHNNIHNFVGGFYGHMTWPEVAAFDPIFWLHHSNVDRLFAIWQALNPDAYIMPTTNSYGSYAEPPGSIDSGSSGLAPFHVDSGSALYTSDAVRDTAALGYTYPELSRPNLNTDQRITYVRNRVNELYAPLPKPSERSVDNLDERNDGPGIRISLTRAKQLGVNNAETQWSVSIQVARRSFNTSYNIDLFLGQPPDVSQRSTADNLIGTYGQFVTDSTCREEITTMPTEMLSGGVSLTHTLSAAVSQGTLLDLSAPSVVPFLRRWLTWAARTEGNQEVNLEQLIGLSIAVQSREVKPRAADCEFPVYGSFTSHPEITQGKPGGVCLDQGAGK